MSKALLPNALWNQIQPLLPPPPRPKRSDRPGRKRFDDRGCLIGILFVLKMGIEWKDLPSEMGCGSGMTCWRRLEYWRQSGAWNAVLERLMADLPGADKIDWSRVAATNGKSLAPASSNGKRTSGLKTPCLLQLAFALGLNLGDAWAVWLEPCAMIGLV